MVVSCVAAGLIGGGRRLGGWVVWRVRVVVVFL